MGEDRSAKEQKTQTISSEDPTKAIGLSLFEFMVALYRMPFRVEALEKSMSPIPEKVTRLETQIAHVKKNMGRYNSMAVEHYAVKCICPYMKKLREMGIEVEEIDLKK